LLGVWVYVCVYADLPQCECVCCMICCMCVWPGCGFLLLLLLWLFVFCVGGDPGSCCCSGGGAGVLGVGCGPTTLTYILGHGIVVTPLPNLHAFCVCCLLLLVAHLN